MCARSAGRASFLRSLIATVDELKSCRVSPADLERAGCEAEGPEGEKLRDLSLICGAYDALTAQVALDPRDRLTRTAEKLYLAQPTLSKRLQNLESELGATLFLRSKHGVTLTPPGRRHERHSCTPPRILRTCWSGCGKAAASSAVRCASLLPLITPPTTCRKCWRSTPPTTPEGQAADLQ